MSSGVYASISDEPTPPSIEEAEGKNSSVKGTSEGGREGGREEGEKSKIHGKGAIYHTTFCKNPDVMPFGTRILRLGSSGDDAGSSN